MKANFRLVIISEPSLVRNSSISKALKIEITAPQTTYRRPHCPKQSKILFANRTKRIHKSLVVWIKASQKCRVWSVVQLAPPFWAQLKTLCVNLLRSPLQMDKRNQILLENSHYQIKSKLYAGKITTWLKFQQPRNQPKTNAWNLQNKKSPENVIKRKHRQKSNSITSRRVLVKELNHQSCDRCQSLTFLMLWLCKQHKQTPLVQWALHQLCMCIHNYLRSLSLRFAQSPLVLSPKGNNNQQCVHRHLPFLDNQPQGVLTKNLKFTHGYGHIKPLQ